MNLYEAIYARRSVRAYRMEPLDDTILKGIPDFLDEVEPLFPDIRTEIILRFQSPLTERESTLVQVNTYPANASVSDNLFVFFLIFP